MAKIGFWGYPHPDKINEIKEKYPDSEWMDLDVEIGAPKSAILPESYCKIIRNIIDNTLYIKPDVILAPIGKDKCDSGWFTSKILADMGFNIIQTIFEDIEPKREIRISRAKLPLVDKITKITAGIIDSRVWEKEYSHAEIPEENTSSNPQFTPGFWGVPPNDMEVLKLFPDTTHGYGWTRCVEAGCPANLDLEMYVNPNVPTVFYAQAFCSKSQLAKYLADKYNGLYIDIDDYASSSIKAKIEAFLKLS